LKGTASSNTKGKLIFRYRLSPETFGYILVQTHSTNLENQCWHAWNVKLHTLIKIGTSLGKPTDTYHTH